MSNRAMIYLAKCACGCGSLLEPKDAYGRNRSYISGHNGRKYPHNDPQAYKKAWVSRNRTWANTRRQAIARDRKVTLLNRLGGKCNCCGLTYDGTNGAVFEFHHTDPSTKLFGIGGELTNKTFDALLQEAFKCELLCANCHQIRHLGEY